MNIYRIAGRSWLSAITFLLSLTFSVAASAATGSLNISVTDADGTPIAGVAVTARALDTVGQRSGVTNSDGEVRLVGLEPSSEYVVTASADGFDAARNEAVLVVSDRTFNLPIRMVAAGEALEEIITYGRSDVGQLIDTGSALQATDLTLDIMDSLPTGRTYQSYLQFAPSTKPTPIENGNPSSKSGVNYQDIVDSNGNTAGTSSDNVYYIDGVNITDVQTGTFGANINSEIIQEQSIITGGVPAEYEGGQGLISRVITKSGSNEFHGSINYYAQSDGLVADNKHLADASFDTFDTAFTLGGPIIRDRLWFFGSLQRKERDEDVIDPNTQSVLRSVNRTEDLGFAKITWQATDNDKVIAEFFNDPTDISGSFNTSTRPNRDLAREQGGDNWKFEYSHSWDNLIATIAYMDHEGEMSSLCADESTRNDVAFTGAALPVTNAQTDLGGCGTNTIDFRNKQELKLELQWFLDTQLGSHDIKFGYVDTTNERNLESVTTGDGSIYTSLGAANAGVSLDDYVGNAVFTGERDIISDDFEEIQSSLLASPDSAYFLGLLDSNNDGAVSDAELGAYQFTSTAGNPTGDVNVYRIARTIAGATNFKTEGNTFYLQDTWSIDDHWTVTAGIRAEEWGHKDTLGNHIFTFDYEFAPRLSVAYDVAGDGTSKIWGFYGRYYDPIRTNMTAFAGTVSGSKREEQVFLGDRWLTFRERGASGTPDGFFAPTIKTPYTDEYMVGYERALTENQSVAVTYTHRVTEDILEDYDLDLYTDPAQCGDLCLGLNYFGFDTAPAANFFIATLAGGKREYDGVEVTWRKRRSGDSKWFGLASYSYNDATGNTNSDSNADFQGDVIWLDPRAINATGPQPGNVEHILKLLGSYRWDNGIEVGGSYVWNSGTLYSQTFAASGRHLPTRVDTAFVDNGVSARWLAPGSIGAESTPSYGTLNARVKYTMDFADRYTAEFFLDIFNVLDDQAPIRQMDLAGGDGVFQFGQASAWVLPRRFFLGARMSF